MTKQAHKVPLRPLLALVLLVLVIPVSCKGPDMRHSGAPQREVPPRNQGAQYDGIDISSYQGYIDWAKVSSDKDIRFVYIKATEGATYRSPHYAHNITQARRYGLLVGSYHYLTSTSSIDEQFNNFSTYALRDVQDLLPMLDVEVRGTWSRSQLIDSVEKFCDLVKDHYGVQPMIYRAATPTASPKSTGRANTPSGSTARAASFPALTPTWTCAATARTAGLTRFYFRRNSFPISPTCCCKAIIRNES